MKYANWQAVVEHYGDYGQVLEGETAEQLATEALEQGEIVSLQEEYIDGSDVITIKKVWQHTVDSECAECGEIIPLETTPGHTYTTAVNKGEGWSMNFCPGHDDIDTIRKKVCEESSTEYHFIIDESEVLHQ